MLKIIVTNIVIGIAIVVVTAALCKLAGIEFGPSSTIVATLWATAKTFHDLSKLPNS